MNQLNDLRELIDACDKEIVLAIEKRFKTVKTIMEYKKKNNLEIYQPNREKEVLLKVESYLQDEEFYEELISLYSHILKLSKDIQRKA